MKEYLHKEWKFENAGNSSAVLICIKGAFAQNLKNIDVEFNEAVLNVITGVSGSGKSSLLYEVIHGSLLANKAIKCKSFHITKSQKAILISDEQLTETQASTPLTFANIHTELFKEIAKNNDQQAKVKPNQFSFNSKEGQCSNCKGHGKIKIPMDFVADVWLTCEQCNGQRYSENVLKFTYQGKTISEIVNMPFNAAADFFKANKQLCNKLVLFKELGLGYLKLNQDFTSISSGELQRIKLIKAMLELKEPAIILMDEPTSGLHFKDIERLMKVIRKLLEKKFTIIAIEHNQQVISHANQRIELGPGGGNEGGRIV